MKKAIRWFFAIIIVLGFYAGPLCFNVGGFKASGAALRTEKNQIRACMVCQYDFSRETKNLWGCP